MRRVEIAFPYKDRERKDIPEGKVQQAINHAMIFKGYNVYRRVGYWRPDPTKDPYYGKEEFVTVDVEDTRKNRWRFRVLKELWTLELNQRELYMATYRVKWFSVKWF